MHSSLLALTLALTPSALASVLPRSTMGSWTLLITESPYPLGENYKIRTYAANFTSDSYPAGLASTCNYIYAPPYEAAETSGCDGGLTYHYNGTTIKLQQGVELPNPQTVFGSAPLVLEPVDGDAANLRGEAVVEVTSAIA